MLEKDNDDYGIWYNKWVARFLNYRGKYEVTIWDEEFSEEETYHCTLECAIAYIHSARTGYDFEPSKMKTKQVLNQRYAEYQLDIKDIQYNQLDGRYLIFFTISGGELCLSPVYA